MNSLEALDRLVELCNHYQHKLINNKKEVQTICGYPIEYIRQDLEVLQILKSKFTICPTPYEKSTYLVAKFYETYNKDKIYPRFIRKGCEYQTLEKVIECLERK